MTAVKHFNHTMPQGPQLTGSPGALINVLDACLVDGFDLKVASSLTVSNGIATLAFNGAHSATVDTVVLVAGASVAALNGEKKVLSIGPGVVRFATTAGNVIASGSITLKMAPAGWTKVFATNNVAVYRSQDVSGTRMYLRVDDTVARNARVRSFESMTDAETGIGACPTEAQLAGGLWWSKSNSADATSRPWWVFADARCFYFGVAPTLVPGSFSVFYAGDFLSRKSGDAYGFAVCGNPSDYSATGSLIAGCVGLSNKSDLRCVYVQRSHTFIGGAVSAAKIGAGHLYAGSEAYSGSDYYSFGTFPNAAGNELLTCPAHIFSGGYRGTFPGALHAVQDMAGSVASGAIIDGTGDYFGRRLLALRLGSSSSLSSVGTIFFDTTGPWRA